MTSTRATAYSLLLLAATVFLTSCGGGSSKSSSSTANEFLFVADLDNSLIDAFTLNNGTVAGVSGTPFTSDYRPISIAAHPSKDFFYVANSGTSTTCGSGGAPGSVTSYSYDKNGTPTKVAEHCLPASPQQLLISSDGSTVYALLLGGMVTTLTVGSSQDVSVSNTYQFSGGAAPTRMALTSDNKTLYATDPTGRLSILAVSGTTLTEASGSPVALADKPADLACCNGSNLYVVDPNARHLSQYTVSSGASAASAVLGGVAQTDQFPNHVFLDSTSKYLLVTNLTVAQLSLFPIDATTGNPQAQTTQVATGVYPTCIFSEPSNKFIFVTNYHANSFSSYSFSSGSLTASSSSGTTGASPICGVGAHPFQ